MDKLRQFYEGEYFDKGNAEKGFDAWKKGNHPYLMMRCRRIDKYVLPRINGVGAILEIGSGWGYITDYLRGRGYLVEGCDISKRIVAQANKFYERNWFYVHDIEESPTAKKYDTIIMFDILEHIFDYDAVLKNVYESLNDKGLVAIHIPNLDGWSVRLRLLAGDTSFFQDKAHIRYFSHDLLKNLLIKHKFKYIYSKSFGFGGAVLMIAGKTAKPATYET